MNIAKLMWNTPPAIVNSLYGIGVNPAVNIIQKLYCSNRFRTFSNASIENTWLKNSMATDVYSPAAFCHRK